MPESWKIMTVPTRATRVLREMVAVTALLCALGAHPARALGKPKGPTGVQIRNAVKDEYFNCADHQWARWAVVNNAPTRIHMAPWSDERIEAYLKKYVPDHILFGIATPYMSSLPRAEKTLLPPSHQWTAEKAMPTPGVGRF